MKLYIILFVFILVIIAFMYSLKITNKPTVTINNQKINLEVARNQQQREKGLSGRKSLPLNTGMLFVFPASNIQNFWNEQMKFPLDVIWINNETIVGVSQLPIDIGDNITVNSSIRVDKVLELPVGTFEKLHIKVGDTVKFKNIPNAL